MGAWSSAPLLRPVQTLHAGEFYQGTYKDEPRRENEVKAPDVSLSSSSPLYKMPTKTPRTVEDFLFMLLQSVQLAVSIYQEGKQVWYVPIGEKYLTTLRAFITVFPSHR